MHVQLLDVGLVGLLVGHHGLSHHADAAQVTPHGIHGRQDHIEAHVNQEKDDQLFHNQYNRLTITLCSKTSLGTA